MPQSLSEQLQQAIHGENQPGQEETAVDENAVVETAEDEDSEEAEIRTLADLAEANEWDISDLYGLEMGVQGDGEDVFSVGELKDKYQAGKSKFSELEQSYQKQTEQLQQMQQQAGQSQQVDAYLRTTMGKVDAINQFLQSPDLQKLRQDDPTAGLVKTQEAKDARDNLIREGNNYYQQQQQQQQIQLQQNLQQATQAVAQGIPSWNDPEVATREKAEIAQSFVKYGYTEADVAGLTDPRQVMIMHRLNAVEKLLGAGAGAANKVRQSPKRSLRGGKIRKGNAKNSAVARAKETGRRQDVTAAAKAILFGG